MGPLIPMAERKITPEEVEQLVEDVAYLQDEAEALRYVIESVPYTQSPPGKPSIAEMLLSIDYVQRAYYRPALEATRDNSRPLRPGRREEVLDDFELDERKAEEIQNVLRKLAKHRAGLVNLIKRIPLIDWEKTVAREGEKLTLVEFVREMVRYERARLKDIADQVMMFNRDRQARRELKQRRERQNKLGADGGES